MNYDTWKQTSRSPVGLLLDLRNPRIPPSSTPLTQARIIEELVTHDDVLEIAKSIVANGFFPNEAVIAIRENGHVVVVEGNRRLAACKLLISPEAAPNDHRKRFNNLSASMDPKSIRKIPVLLAPSRDATNAIVISRHTASQVQRWVPLMQARFYGTLLDAGSSIEEVAARFGLSAADITKSVRTSNLYDMACKLPLDDDTARIVRNPRSFSVTNLDRIFDVPEARKFFGVEFSNDGTVRGHINAGEFKKGFTRVVSDVAHARKDSRELNSSKEIIGYLRGFEASEIPDHSVKGSFDSTNFPTDSGTQASPLKGSTKKSGGRRSNTPTGLIPRSFRCGIANAKVQSLFAELRGLSPAKFPNSCAFAFRSFLETSVFCFLKRKGEIVKMIAEQRAKIATENISRPANKQKALPADWSPSLAEMLTHVIEDKSGLVSDPQVTRALKTVISQNKELITLNLIVHNSTYHASEPKLRATWNNFEEFMREICQ